MEVEFDLSGFHFMSSSQLLRYRTEWDLFNTVQIYNSNVSTVNGGMSKTVPYYIFKNFNEKASFKNGQFLHQKRYPNSNWNAIVE
jgi:hypothetical protein